MTAPSVIRPTVRRVPATTFMLVAAWVVASLEGYDLAVYGVTVPAILGDPSLGIDKAEAGTIGSLVGIGMLIGAALAGALVHRTGPRQAPARRHHRLLARHGGLHVRRRMSRPSGPGAWSSASASASSCRRSTHTSPTSANRAAAAATSP